MKHSALNPDRKGDWMQTYSGRQYWPLDPRAHEVSLRDIVHHLGNICRYCGACHRFYSVLEHSIGVYHVAYRQAVREGFSEDEARDIALVALVHDAPEAYVHDLIRPIKRCVVGYDEVELANADAIEIALDIPSLSADAKQRVKWADNAMLLAEQAVLMAPKPAEWKPIAVPYEMVRDADHCLRLARWLPWRRSRWWLKRRFIKIFEELKL